MLAAMDAGIDMRCVPLSIPLGLMQPRVLARTAAFPSSSSSSSAAVQGEDGGEGVEDGEGSVLVLDPTAAEEKAAAATMVGGLGVLAVGLFGQITEVGRVHRTTKSQSTSYVQSRAHMHMHRP